jgi:hypothetical protein
MFSKSKLTLIAVIAATAFAAPAFAQSVDHTGTLFPSYYDGNSHQMLGSWAPQATAGKHVLAVQPRSIYNYAAVPAPAQAATPMSGYDPSIATQR